jgi:hypothetical protein
VAAHVVGRTADALDHAGVGGLDAVGDAGDVVEAGEVNIVLSIEGGGRPRATARKDGQRNSISSATMSVL